MSGGFFRGTSADQDTRFSNKQAKLLKSQKFAPELEHLVDMTKVQMDAIKPWIAKRVTELLGFEDEVLINFIYGLLEGKEVNGKEIQISLTGFMEKNTGKFMKELWERLLSAQKNPSGVPQQELDAKAEDLRRKKAEDERLVKDILKKKDKENNESARETERNRDEGYDRKAFDSDVEPSSKHARRKMSSEKADEDGDVEMKNGFRRKRRSGSASSDHKHSSPRFRSPSVSKSLSNSRSYESDRRRSRSVSRSVERRKCSVSAERGHPSPTKRSVTPHSRHSNRSSLSPPRRRSFYRRSHSRSLRRSPSPSRRRLSSPYRHRSPSTSHRRRPLSPYHRRSPSPYRRRSPSPVRSYRSPSPARRRRIPTPPRWHRRRSPTPRRRRSPSRDRRRSPSLARHRRSPSPVRHRRSPSPARRHRSPFLHRRRRSPSFDRRRRSPSPYQRDRSPPPYKHRRSLSPYQRGRSGSPPCSSKSFSPSRSLSPVSLARKSPVAVSPLRRHRSLSASGSPLASRFNSPVTSPRRRSSPSAQKRYQRSSSPTQHRSVGRLSSTSRARNSVSPVKDRSSASPSLSLLKSAEERRSHRKHEQLSPRPHQPSSARLRERSPDEDARELSAKGVQPRTPDQQRSATLQDFLVGGKESLLQPSVDKGSAELNNPQKNNAQGSDEHDEIETASLLVGKVDCKNGSVDSESEESDSHRRKRKRKHKRFERKEASSDDTHDSELDERKEAKRKKKEERRSRKEEKRRRREERHRRREERRAEKLKMKGQLKMKGRDDSDVSDVEHTVKGSHWRNDDVAESERKRLEFELRQKALESLKAKKGISS